jgi:hypothetical protein
VAAPHKTTRSSGGSIMKCVNSNRHVSRIVVSFVTNLERAAQYEKPGVSRRSTTWIIMTQPINLNKIYVKILNFITTE